MMLILPLGLMGITLNLSNQDFTLSIDSAITVLYLAMTILLLLLPDADEKLAIYIPSGSECKSILVVFSLRAFA
jgi:hypothetical protein